MTVKILITGDNHLDSPSKNFGTNKNERQRDYQRNFKTIVEYAIENEVDVFLICGDLFDHNRPSNSTRAWVMKQFRRLKENGASSFLVTGHHDTPRSIVTGVSPLQTHGESGNVTYFENPSQPRAVDIQVDGMRVRVVGIGFNPTLQAEDNPLDVEMPPPDGDLNILLLHYPIIGFSGFIGDEVTVSPDQIPVGYQLIAAGHYHSAQHKRIGDSLVVIPGSTERVSFNEEGGEKSFTILEFEDNEIPEVKRIPLNCREMKTLLIKVKDGDNITNIVEQEIEEVANPELILRIRIEGVVAVETLATYKRSKLQRMGDDLCFRVILEDTDSLKVEGVRDIEPISAIDPDEELLSYFDAKMKDMDEDSRAIVEQAKSKCIELMEEVSRFDS